MIPLHKLAKLPRHQRLRKAAKIIESAERKVVASGKLATEELEYICALIKLLADDGSFSEPAAGVFKTALSMQAGKEIRRSLNNVYHILLSETGTYRSDWDFMEESGALDPAKRQPFPGMQIYLEDIRSPFNVGSMFRAAESFGADKLWLSPLCADPKHKRAERTAMGCVDALPWERFSQDPFAEEPEISIHGFLEEPFFALETGGTPLEDFSFPQKGIIIAGSEELGVSPQALAAADSSLGRVSITSYGAKGSLNVSVAFGIVMQAWASALSKFGIPACKKWL